MKKIIATTNAPAAVGPYSQAVEINGTLYISGQIPIDPSTGKLTGENVTAQTEQVMKNVSAILKAAGYDFADVVKTTCLLADMADFKAMNEVYTKYYTTEQPARVTFAVKGLPLEALVEIETVAAR
jgi:2-iminobutanoate/2-iminopropanoate deaminase